jgi:hypothetical protein
MFARTYNIRYLLKLHRMTQIISQRGNLSMHKFEIWKSQSSKRFSRMTENQNTKYFRPCELCASVKSLTAND